MTPENKGTPSMPQPQRKPKKHATALLLSVFLGSIGADRFYLGHVWTGIGKLVVWATASALQNLAPWQPLNIVIMLTAAAWVIADIVRIAQSRLGPASGEYHYPAGRNT